MSKKKDRTGPFIQDFKALLYKHGIDNFVEVIDVASNMRLGVIQCYAIVEKDDKLFLGIGPQDVCVCPHCRDEKEGSESEPK